MKRRIDKDSAEPPRSPRCITVDGNNDPALWSSLPHAGETVVAVFDADDDNAKRLFEAFASSLNNERGANDHPVDGATLPDNMRLYSIGATPEQSVAHLAAHLGWGKLDNWVELEGGDPAFAWGFRFTVDGTGMKAAGINIPGGSICTWWK